MNKFIMAIDKITGTLFDDFTMQNSSDDYDFDCDTWAQVCDKCAKEHRLQDSYLELGAGHGICGVLGCNEQSDHYYDFNRTEKEFINHGEEN